jgi:hypothetical protein
LSRGIFQVNGQTSTGLTYKMLTSARRT